MSFLKYCENISGLEEEVLKYIERVDPDKRSISKSMKLFGREVYWVGGCWSWGLLSQT